MIGERIEYFMEKVCYLYRLYNYLIIDIIHKYISTYGSFFFALNYKNEHNIKGKLNL